MNTGTSLGFEFGRNWRAFLRHIDETAILRAEQSLQEALRAERLDRLTFLDLGCGSGLFSLAAWRLGADVCSLDVDPECVGCATELRNRFASAHRWKIEPGSALDEEFLSGLPRFDVVYSWGVLHHTGAMWRAMGNALARVAPEGRFFAAIYNDQGRASRRWGVVKRWYNQLPSGLRWAVLYPALIRLWGPTVLRDSLRLAPLKAWRGYQSVRGMNAWRDVVDWVGGYPFEVARPEEVFEFCRQRGFGLEYLKTCGGGLGCNEFVFRMGKTWGLPGIERGAEVRDGKQAP